MRCFASEPQQCISHIFYCIFTQMYFVNQLRVLLSSSIILDALCDYWTRKCCVDAGTTSQVTYENISEKRRCKYFCASGQRMPEFGHLRKKVHINYLYLYVLWYITL